MSNPVTVTLSGNSTPLLPGCGECAALRARLAEAEARAGRAEEAVRILAEYAGAADGRAGPFKAWSARRLIDARDAVMDHPAARAAVEGSQ